MSAWFPKRIVQRIQERDPSVLTITRFCLDCGNYSKDSRDGRFGYICPMCTSHRNIVTRYRDVDDGDIVFNRFGCEGGQPKQGKVMRKHGKLLVLCDGNQEPISHDWWLQPDLTLRISPTMASFNFGQHIDVIVDKVPVSVICVGTDNRGEFFFIRKDSPGDQILTGFFDGAFNAHVKHKDE